MSFSRAAGLSRMQPPLALHAFCSAAIARCSVERSMLDRLHRVTLPARNALRRCNLQLLNVGVYSIAPWDAKAFAEHSLESFRHVNTLLAEGRLGALRGVVAE